MNPNVAKILFGPTAIRWNLAPTKRLRTTLAPDTLDRYDLAGQARRFHMDIECFAIRMLQGR